jgi:hypothetical protein
LGGGERYIERCLGVVGVFFFVVSVKFRIFRGFRRLREKNEENNKLIKQNKTVVNTETKTEEDNLLRLINIFFVKAVCVCLGRGNKMGLWCSGVCENYD